MKKIVVLLIIVFLVTGCRVKYNLVINEDLTITEDALLTGTEDFFDNYYKTTRKNVLKSHIDIYKDILDENNYQYEIKDGTVPYVLVTRKYENFSEYVEKSKLFNGYFDTVQYTEDDNIKKLETIGFHDNEPDNSDRFDVKSLEITIKCPYVVKNHNAVKVDKVTNTYYYELSEENNHILIEYDVNKRFNPNTDLYRMIIICMLIIAVVWIVVIYLDKKNKKKN